MGLFESPEKEQEVKTDQEMAFLDNVSEDDADQSVFSSSAIADDPSEGNNDYDGGKNKKSRTANPSRYKVDKLSKEQIK